jgi:hypothetical protein
LSSKDFILIQQALYKQRSPLTIKINSDRPLLDTDKKRSPLTIKINSDRLSPFSQKNSDRLSPFSQKNSDRYQKINSKDLKLDDKDTRNS